MNVNYPTVVIAMQHVVILLDHIHVNVNSVIMVMDGIIVFGLGVLFLFLLLFNILLYHTMELFISETKASNFLIQLHP